MLQGDIRAGQLGALAERRRVQRADGSLVRENGQCLRIILVLAADDRAHALPPRRARRGNARR